MEDSWKAIIGKIIHFIFFLKKLKVILLVNGLLYLKKKKNKYPLNKFQIGLFH